MEVVGTARTIGNITGQGLLTVHELSFYLGVSPYTIYRWVERQEIPIFKRKGLGIRFRKEEIDSWLEKSKCRPLPDPPDLTDLTRPPRSTKKRSHGETGGTGEMPKGKIKSRHNYGFGAIYQRRTKQGIIRWCIDYRDAARKRVQRVIRNAQTPEDAALALRAAVSESRDRELGIRQKPGRISFTKFSEMYLENYAKINKRSWTTDVSYVKSMNSKFGSLYLDEISPLETESYKAARLRQGVRPSTVNRCLAILRKMLRLAVEWGYLPKDAVPKMKFFPEKDNIKERILAPDEERRLFGASSSALRPILTVALNTGMRLGEILGLRWNQVDLKSRTIRVERTKSGKIRFIEINSPLLHELSHLKGTDGRSPYVFPNPATGKSLTTVKTAFKAACRRAEIHGLRFHDLRHTFATRLNMLGVDPITIKELLGHSSLKLTERYTHSNQEQKRTAVERLAGDSQSGQDLLRICDAAGEAKDPAAVSHVISTI
ncbi:MAG: tyrosine-type recombinase/integrase [Candidatus Aminicenantales bacterium]